MRSVGGVKKSIHQSWLAKGLGLGLGLLCWGFKGVQEEIPWEEASTLQIGSVHNSILVTDYLSKMDIKTVTQPPYGSDLAPCDFCLFPKLRGCHYEMRRWKRLWWRSLTCSHYGAFQKLLEQYNKSIAAGGDYFKED